MSIKNQVDELSSITEGYIKKLNVQYSTHVQWLSEFTIKSKKELAKPSLNNLMATPSGNKEKTHTRSSTTRVKSRRDSKRKKKKDSEVLSTPSNVSFTKENETPNTIKIIGKSTNEIKSSVEDEDEEIERIREQEREEEIERLRYEMNKRREEEEEELRQEELRQEEERKYLQFLEKERERKEKERIEQERKEEEKRLFFEQLRLEQEEKERQEEEERRRIQKEKEEERRRIKIEREREEERKRIQKEEEEERIRQFLLDKKRKEEEEKERRRIYLYKKEQERMEEERIKKEEEFYRLEKERKYQDELIKKEEERRIQKNENERFHLKKNLGTPSIYPDLPSSSNGGEIWSLDQSFNNDFQNNSNIYLTPDKSNISKQMERIKSKSPNPVLTNSLMNELKSKQKEEENVKDTPPSFIDDEVQKYLQVEIPEFKDIYKQNEQEDRFSTTSSIISISTTGSSPCNSHKNSTSPPLKKSMKYPNVKKIDALEKAERERIREEEKQRVIAERKKKTQLIIEQKKKEKKLKEENEKMMKREEEKKKQTALRDQLNQLKGNTSTNNSNLNTSNLSSTSSKINKMKKMGPPPVSKIKSEEEILSSYKLSDISYKSESEDEEEEMRRRAKKKIPIWAQGKALGELVERTRKIDPNLIFGDFTTLNISDIWKYETGISFRSRSSSGNWDKDHFTKKEESEYRKKMGYHHYHEINYYKK
eukprot:gene2869-4712_t